MASSSNLALFVCGLLSVSTCLAACPDDGPPIGEGEGEIDVDDGGEGEGEGDADGEGEGDIAGEGEGEVAGEGEGEGEVQPDSCMLDTNKPLPNPGAVYFGTRLPTHVVLTDAQQRAIVGVGAGQPPGAFCSGTLITGTLVITATHCTVDTAASDFYITVGIDDANPEDVIRAVEKFEHPEVDISILRLERDATLQNNITPIPISPVDLAEADFGSTHEQAGFGDTDQGGGRGRFFVAEPLDGFEEPGGYLVVNGNGQRGVCFGDSGGPSLRIQANGEARVVGTLSYGDPSCVGRDRYTRTDLVRSFIENIAGVTPPIGEGDPCAGVTSIGDCSPDSDVARYCAGGVLIRDECGASGVCRVGANGARCVDNADDICNGETALGRCDGDVLHWCNGTEEVVRDCGGCGELCILIDNAVGSACIENNCGDVDYLGLCDGDTARWCSRGELSEETCTAGCGFVSDTSGFYCLDPACNGIDYRGMCDGDTARWCDEGSLREEACTTGCSFIDEDTGFYCRDP
jgi:hypothetical protein